MAHPAVVVVLVAAADAQDPSTAALTAAARNALGPEAIVVVQEVESVPPKGAATAIGTKLHADAVASVTWSLPDRKRAHVRVIVVTDGRAFERDLEFGANDAQIERGRTVGLAIVAMIPEPSSAPPPEPPPPSMAEPPIDAPSPSPPPRKEPPFRPRVGLELFAASASGPFGVGGGVGMRWLGIVPLRLAGSIRTGRLADDATMRATDFDLGVSPVFFDGRTTLGARVEAGVTHQSVTVRLDERDAVGSRFVPHARGLVEGTVWIAPAFGLSLASGVELAFGETRIVVGGEPITTIPRARLVFELALRGRL